MARSVRCRSGLRGTQEPLQAPYTSFDDFAMWDAIYSLAARLGFTDALELWNLNPMIQSSVNPSDYRMVNTRAARKR